MIKAWGITDRGAVRQQNQDAYYLDTLTDEQVLCVVCDGMGGALAGNVASRLAVETFVENLRLGVETCPEPMVQELLSKAVTLANQAVYRRATTDLECRGMGTTLVAALARGRTVHILNIGDSRCYHVTGEGISKVTRDHSVVEDLVERGKLTPEAARTHPQKNLITRALGAEEYVPADYYQVQMGEGDAILLCSDGLSNMVSDQEILYEILHGGECESCCQRLLNIALSRGAPDNVTAILMQG